MRRVTLYSIKYNIVLTFLIINYYCNKTLGENRYKDVPYTSRHLSVSFLARLSDKLILVRLV